VTDAATRAAQRQKPDKNLDDDCDGNMANAERVSIASPRNLASITSFQSQPTGDLNPVSPVESSGGVDADGTREKRKSETLTRVTPSRLTASSATEQRAAVSLTVRSAADAPSTGGASPSISDARNSSSDTFSRTDRDGIGRPVASPRGSRVGLDLGEAYSVDRAMGMEILSMLSSVDDKVYALDTRLSELKRKIVDVGTLVRDVQG